VELPTNIQVSQSPDGKGKAIVRREKKNSERIAVEYYSSPLSTPKNRGLFAKGERGEEGFQHKGKTPGRIAEKKIGRRGRP